ncbi:hypothetical protein SAMN05660462_02159 [Proteiniborus ethanoligenes]|uniref:Uncharacterized protein n=1 Tax=Proteiniborus ethanoligenes TaxID=415015 RepID=A0A1H3R1U4_9FIRM|nr:hypothetical protein [Proteiniborus ethanoligenes]SDZ19275.1 hypothetical protein SAMN05660462_02159 [Proteiniborus ethanoligenes]
MSKVKIELNELSKLYDEIYYANLEGVDVALDIISNITSEKEFEDSEEPVLGLSNIVDLIVEILDEVSEAFESEGLYDILDYVKDKIDKIQSGELDEYIEDTYINFLDEDLDNDFDDDDDLYNDEEYDEDDLYDDEY